MEHIHEHDHPHTHEGGGHVHSHDHEHPHDHAHPHGHGPVEGKEKTAALLQYMLDHNTHHCGELKEMADGLDGEARHQLLHAVECFDEANGHLAKAIGELKK